VANPVFSIMIPVYNAEAYLAECLDSVKNQTFPDFEAIIVDDGSTDGSGAAVDGYALADPRFHVYHTPNQGALTARKFAQDKSRGRYLLFIDSDDFLEPVLLERVKEQFDLHGCDMVVYDSRTIEADGREREINSLFESPMLFDSGNKSVLWHMLLTTRMNPLWIKCFKRELADIPVDYNKFRALLRGDDLLLSPYLLCAAQTVAYINEPLYNYRAGIGKSNRFLPDALKNKSMVVDVIYSLMTENGLDTPENLLEFKCMCRKMTNNFLGLMSGQVRSFGENIRLIKALSGLTIYENALSAECDPYFSRQKNMKFAMLRAGMYAFVVAAQKIKHS